MSGLVPFIILTVIDAVVLPRLSDASQTVSAQPLLSCQCRSFAGAIIIFQHTLSRMLWQVATL
jgi:hypothetical protein